MGRSIVEMMVRRRYSQSWVGRAFHQSFVQMSVTPTTMMLMIINIIMRMVQKVQQDDADDVRFDGLVDDEDVAVVVIRRHPSDEVAAASVDVASVDGESVDDASVDDDSVDDDSEEGDSVEDY